LNEDDAAGKDHAERAEIEHRDEQPQKENQGRIGP
jgi:hypothetical protein